MTVVPLVVLVVLVLWLRRANELCVLRVDGESVRVLRGAVPPGLVAEVSDVGKRAVLQGVTLHVVSEGGAPRLLPPRRVPEDAAQQLRNVIGRYPLLRFRRGRR